MTIKLVHNVTTGEISEVELDADELAQLESDKAKKIKDAEALNVKQDAKAAIAERLGLTDAELATLLA
jgi:hypothetical protein